MLNFDDAAIEEALRSVRATNSVPKYLSIQKRCREVNVSTDPAFRMEFNGFYRVSRRTSSWYDAFYAYFERAKGQPQAPVFDEVLFNLRETTGRIRLRRLRDLVSHALAFYLGG